MPSNARFLGYSRSNSSNFWTAASDFLSAPSVQGCARSPHAMESSGFRLMTNAKGVSPISSNDGPWKKQSGKSLEERESDANFSYETVSPSASAERGQPPPPARAAERGALPQTDPHRCPCRLRQNH